MTLFDDKVKVLSARSDSALSVFNKTVEKLKAVTASATESIRINQTKINELAKENLELQSIADENERVVKKIEDFLS